MSIVGGGTYLIGGGTYVKDGAGEGGLGGASGFTANEGRTYVAIGGGTICDPGLTSLTGLIGCGSGNTMHAGGKHGTSTVCPEALSMVSEGSVSSITQRKILATVEAFIVRFS
jgi:hypothetical protein